MDTSVTQRLVRRRCAATGVQLQEGKGNCPGIGVGQEMDNIFYGVIGTELGRLQGEVGYLMGTNWY